MLTCKLTSFMLKIDDLANEKHINAKDLIVCVTNDSKYALCRYPVLIQSTLNNNLGIKFDEVVIELTYYTPDFRFSRDFDLSFDRFYINQSFSHPVLVLRNSPYLSPIPILVKGHYITELEYDGFPTYPCRTAITGDIVQDYVDRQYPLSSSSSKNISKVNVDFMKKTLNDMFKILKGKAEFTKDSLSYSHQAIIGEFKKYPRRI